MDTILYITDLHVGSHVVELAGVFDRANAYRWRVVEIEMDRTSRTIPEIIAQWKPAGCIMECGKFLGEDIPSLFGKTPVVYIDPNPSTAKKARGKKAYSLRTSEAPTDVSRTQRRTVIARE